MCQLNPLFSFIQLVVGGVIGFLIICMFVNAIISWLLLFDVIRLGSPGAHAVVNFLDAVTRPILRPFRRFIPLLGGVDLSPLVALLVLIGINNFLLPGGLAALQRLLGWC